MITERIVDIYGDAILHPEFYHETAELAKKMIDRMRDDNVDCSDVHVVLNDLFSDFFFTADVNMQRKMIKDTETEERNLRLAADLSDLKLAYFHLRKDYQKNENALRELKISFEKLKVESRRRERDLLKRLWKTQIKNVVDRNGLEKELK